MSVKITITDNRKEFDAVQGRLRGLGRLSVGAGLFEAVQAAKGFWHEFGLGVPARPWMGPATDDARERGAVAAEKALIRVITGAESPADALGEVGEVFADAQRAIIEEGRVGGPPLSLEAMRNDPRKLIDTGDMVRSIESRVERDGGKS